MTDDDLEQLPDDYDAFPKRYVASYSLEAVREMVARLRKQRQTDKRKEQDNVGQEHG